MLFRRLLRRPTAAFQRGIQLASDSYPVGKSPIGIDFQSKEKRAESHTKPLSTPPPISQQEAEEELDYSEYSKLLEKEGFSKEQAEGLVANIKRAIDESLQAYPQLLVTREDQSNYISENARQLQRIQNEIKSLEKKDFSALKSNIETIRKDLEEIKGRMRLDIAHVHSGVRLDIDLEKNRITVENEEVERDLDSAKLKIEEQFDRLHERMNRVR